MSTQQEDRVLVSLCCSKLVDVLPVIQLSNFLDSFLVRRSEAEWVAKYIEKTSEVPKLKQLSRHYPDVKTRQRAEPLSYTFSELRKEVARERAIAASDDIAKCIEAQDMDKYLELIKACVEETEALTAATTDECVDVDVVTDTMIASIDAQGINALRVIPTGLDPLDSEVGGLEPGIIYVLASLINLGKTYLALKVAETARAFGYKVGFYSLEMPSGHIVNRTLCVRYKLDADQYVKRLQPEASVKSGENRVQWYRRLLVERNDLLQKDSCTGKVYVRSADDEPINPRRIAADIKRLDLDLVIIDAAQDLTDNKNSKERTPGIYNALRELNGVAMGSKPVPILCTVQLDSEVEKKNLTKGNLTRVAWGQAFAQKAGVLMTMLGDRSTGDRDVLIEKNREGTVGKPFKVRMMFPFVDIIAEEVSALNITFDDMEMVDDVSDLDRALEEADKALQEREEESVVTHPTHSRVDYEEPSPEGDSPHSRETPYQARVRLRSEKKKFKVKGFRR